MSKRLRFVKDVTEPLRIAPGSVVDLGGDHDPADTGHVSHQEGKALLAQGVGLLTEYQDRLAAQDTFGLLAVLQGLDASGKDGTIKHVMSGVNPAGVVVRSFKEVLVVRVHPEVRRAERLPETAQGDELWTRRFREINQWERYLADNGIAVVKIMLNLSRSEQARRFRKRLDHPEKNWKFSPADIRERSCFGDYQRAFSEMLSQTSTPWAPWHVVPADHKWFARLATAAAVIRALRDINPQYPVPDAAARAELAQARAELAAESSS